MGNHYRNVSETYAICGFEVILDFSIKHNIVSLAAMKTIFRCVLFVSLLFLLPIILEAKPQSYGSSLRKGGEDPADLMRKARTLYVDSPSTAIDLVADVIMIGLQRDDKNLQATGYKFLGDINQHLAQYDLATANYRRALQLFKEIGNNVERVKLYKLLGDAFYKDNKLDEALTYYHRYLNSANEDKKVSTRKEKYQFKEPSKVDYGLDNSANDRKQVQLLIAEIYNKKKEYKASKDNIGRAFNGFSDTNKFDKISVEDYDLNFKAGDILSEQNDTLAVNYYRNSLNTAQKNNDPLKVTKALDRIATYYSKTGKLEESKDLRQQNIQILSNSGNRADLANEYLEIGFLEKEMDNFRDAEASFEKSVDLAEESEQIELQARGLQEVADLKVNRGLLQEALIYYQRYAVLKDSIYKLKQEELQQKLRVNSVVNQKQQRIEILEKNDEINEKTIEILQQNSRTQRVLIYSLLGGILLIGGLGYLMYKNLRQRRIANQLIALRSLRSQMNPHFIFNALNSVNLYISQKDERSANRYLTEFSRLMRSVLEQSQKDFITLQQEVEMISLYSKLENDRFKDKFDYKLEVDDQIDQENLLIPPMIVQPYVENAIWHGLRYKETKGELYIGYLKKEDHIKVLITDNGIGRKRSKELKTANQQKTQSTGMYNIENRLEIINQMFDTGITLNINDLTEEYGTKVEIDIPLKS